MAAPTIAFGAAAAFMLVNVVDPTSGAVANPQYQEYQTTVAQLARADAQSLTVATADTAVEIEPGFESVAAPPPPPPVVESTPATGSGSGSSAKSSGSSGGGAIAIPDPGSAKGIARSILASQGMGDDQYACLDYLWTKESGWRVNAYNPSGAYGIPQALPGSKMASAGADWQTNPATQITWGLGYIDSRYGSPCGAKAHSVLKNWY
ncbi:lytic transglycosylase domain-containing protein [Clavibacter michiganensis subsp. phaseoli]|uniref:lytic transglycosylase domain-containing protein n=1 Tax=Clavibacter phaseoli TaxID=1734031 RepID=UPI001F28A418|nr:lytic transglycosylase domain-containing protein [Clavibacter phaseoli]MCJ1710833.1 lytic transglycosylase domain-containing protein [Clavibacter phaseoli]